MKIKPNNKILALLIIILLPLMTLTTVPTYTGKHNTSINIVPLKTKNSEDIISTANTAREDSIFKIVSSRSYSEVYVNDSLILGVVLIMNNSYVVLENVTLGNGTQSLTIQVYDTATLVIKKSTLVNSEIYIYGSGKVIIQDSRVRNGATNEITTYDASMLSIENVSTHDSDLYISSYENSHVTVRKFIGNLYVTAGGFTNIELNNIYINSTGYFFVYNGVNLYVNELFNLTSSSNINFDMYNSTARIINATFINYVSIMLNSMANISYSKISGINIGQYFWQYIEKSYAVLTNTTVFDSMYIYSIKPTRIYDSIINRWILTMVYNNTDVLILPGGINGSYYLPVMIYGDSVVYDKVNLTDSCVILNSRFLVNNSATLNALWIVNSTGLLNDSSIVNSLFLFYSDVRISNGSYAINIEIYDGSTLEMLNINMYFNLYVYRNSFVLIDNITISDLANIFIYIENSTLILNNSELIHIGDFLLYALDKSVIEIINTSIANGADYGSTMHISNTELKFLNSRISEASLMSIQAEFSNITISNSNIVMPTGEDYWVNILESIVLINDSLVNATIYGDIAHSSYYGSGSLNITYRGAYIEIRNTSEFSLILIHGYAKIMDSSLYSVKAYGNVELFNSSVLSSVLYHIKVINGELNISHGLYYGSGIESSLYLDNNCSILASAIVVITTLMAYNSIVRLYNVTTVIYLNITNSELLVKDSGIGYIPTINYYSFELSLFINSTIVFDNVVANYIDQIYAYKSDLSINNSNIYSFIYTYSSNLSIYNSYVEEVITGLLIEGNYADIFFNDTGDIYVSGSSIDSLIIISYGEHIINSSSINFLGCVLSNVTIGNYSSIVTLMETYHWVSNGYVLNNISYGYYQNVTIEPDGTVTLTNKTLGVIVKEGYVWVNNSYLSGAAAIENGHLYINSSKVTDVAAIDSGIVELFNVTMYETLLMDTSRIKISNSTLYTIYLFGTNNLECYNVNILDMIYSINDSIKLYDSEIQFFDAVNSSIKAINTNFTEIYLSNSTATMNNSHIRYLFAHNSTIKLNSSHFIDNILLYSGEIDIVNTTSSSSASITVINGKLVARNVNTSTIGILDFLYYSYSWFAGYYGANDDAYISMMNSNVSSFYGMHFIVRKGGLVIFDNDTLIDEKNSVTKLSTYVNCTLGTELATFYITDFTNVKINNYKESNNKAISSLIVMQFTDDTNPIVERLHEENISVEFGVMEIPLEWNVTDDNPWYYELYLNETLIATGNIEKVHTVEINASDVIGSPGEYLIKLIAYDYAGNIGESDVTKITVLNNEAPEITVNIESIEFELGMSPSNITWTLRDATPTNYELYLNDTLIKGNNYTSGDKVVFLTKNQITSAGTYILKLIAFDGVGNNSSSIIIITAHPEEAPEIFLYPKNEYNITTGNHILLNWTASDKFPSTYQILINNTIVESGSWNRNDLITYNFTEIEIGTYIVKIVFNDEAGHSSIHTVKINVLPEKRPSTPGPRPLGVTEIIVLVIVGIASITTILLIVILHVRRK